MARFNEILAGRYNRFLQKLFGMKGGPPAPQLAGDIQVAFNLFSGNENRFLETWNRYSMTANVAANVAGVSAARIRNPSTSNVVAVVEKVFVSNANAAAMGVEIRSGDNPADLNAQSLANSRFDRRGNVAPSLSGSTDNTGAGLAITPVRLKHDTLPVGGFIDVIGDAIVEIPLLPGDGLEVRSIIANVILQCCFWWRERSLEESERT